MIIIDNNIIWHLQYIVAIQFSYKIIANDVTYSIEGDKHGAANGGNLATINLEDDEHILY
ncbi:4393_t:CDS:2 [Entrophospora sp. SA101]|nr:4393_t:CDS:2 [Entrophospora sp. SA101]